MIRKTRPVFSGTPFASNAIPPNKKRRVANHCDEPFAIKSRRQDTVGQQPHGGTPQPIGRRGTGELHVPETNRAAAVRCSAWFGLELSNVPLSCRVECRSQIVCSRSNVAAPPAESSSATAAAVSDPERSGTRIAAAVGCRPCSAGQTFTIDDRRTHPRGLERRE